MIDVTLENFEDEVIATSMTQPVLVDCDPGAADEAAAEIARLPAFAAADGKGVVRPEVTSAGQVRVWLAQGPRYREGLYRSTYSVSRMARMAFLRTVRSRRSR